MSTAIVTTEGPVAIPAGIRRKKPLETGDRVEFVENEEGRILLLPATGEIRRPKMGQSENPRSMPLEELGETWWCLEMPALATRRSSGRISPRTIPDS